MKFKIQINKYFKTSVFLILCVNVFGQFDFENQIVKKKHTVDIVDSIYGITIYEPLNIYLNSDSTRFEKGYAINGWKEDYYDTGQLLHRGYYIDGQLKVYKNYFPNGKLERSFKVIDAYRSKVLLYYPNGNIKSKISYANNFATEWIDYNKNGQLSYHEKYNNDQISHELKIDYYENGNKRDELIVVNKKKKYYDFNEYYNNGLIKTQGHLKFEESKFDYVKYGNWSHFNKSGEFQKKDKY